MKRIQYGAGVLLVALLVAGGVLTASSWLISAAQFVTTSQNEVEAAAALPVDVAIAGNVALAWAAPGELTENLPVPNAEEAATLPDLGSISLAFLLDKTDGPNVTGYVDLGMTLTFTGYHTILLSNAVTSTTELMGPKVNGTYQNGVLSLLSERFPYTTASGQATERQFRLVGSASPGPGILLGEYRETIWGFGLDPVTVVGSFELKDLQAVLAAANQPPVANGANLTTQPGVAVAVQLTGSDPEGATLTYAIGTAPLNGSLSGTPPNTTYTPKAGFIGNDSFTFTVNDGMDLSDPAAVTIVVAADAPANRAPTASGQTIEAVQGQAKPITLTGTDPDSNTLTYAVVAQPGHGTLTGTAPNLVYTAAAGYEGPDSFTFKVNDGKVDSPVATVSITVNGIDVTGDGSRLFLPNVVK